MYELIQVATHTWYINCPAKMGVVGLGDDRVCLIDSGNDKDAGKKIQKILEAQGWSLGLILNTHAHADHIGGNAILQQRMEVQALAPPAESAFARHPWLEPSLLYGGYPCKALRNKFLQAQPSKVDELTAENLPEGFKSIDLSGHYFDMVGYRTPDDIWFLADCVSSEIVLQKYHVGFLYDVQAYLDTLDRVSGLAGALFIPAHTEPVKDMAPLCRLNRAKVEEIASLLLRFCREPLSFEQILQKTFAEYNLTMDWNQHVLVGSTVRSYLSWLLDQGKLCTEFQDNLLLWHSS